MPPPRHCGHPRDARNGSRTRKWRTRKDLSEESRRVLEQLLALGAGRRRVKARHVASKSRRRVDKTKGMWSTPGNCLENGRRACVDGVSCARVVFEFRIARERRDVTYAARSRWTSSSSQKNGSSSGASQKSSSSSSVAASFGVGFDSLSALAAATLAASSQNPSRSSTSTSSGEDEGADDDPFPPLGAGAFPPPPTFRRFLFPRPAPRCFAVRAVKFDAPRGGYLHLPDPSRGNSPT